MRVHRKIDFDKHKINLYFDENFPREIITELQESRRWRKRIRFHLKLEAVNRGKSDSFHYAFCKKNELTLITSDRGFISEKKYKICGNSGIIVATSTSNSVSEIRENLLRTLGLILKMPYAKDFLGHVQIKSTNEG